MMGFVHIYTGDGKGKTTSSIGLALRGYGWGKKVCYIQFLKRDSFPSGERNVLERLGKDFKFIRYDQEHPMFWKPSDWHNEERIRQLKESIANGVKEAKEIIRSGIYDIVVLDELINTVSQKFIDEEKVIELIQSKPEPMELILTGRGATQRLIDLANYVTEMKNVKHPLDDPHIPARKGIEF